MFLRFLLLAGFFCVLNADAIEYKMGHGVRLHDMLSVGGYVSSEYESGKGEDTFTVDDLAFLAYGTLSSSVNYMAELESVNFYTYDFRNETSRSDTRFHIERLYFDYRYSDTLGVRAGKFITPMGYWNLEPINVLRDTTSNPFYAIDMFPRFVTGVDINGYVPGSDSTTYHLFGQKNKDLDEHYINIPNEHFFGLSIYHAFDMAWNVGGSIGQFETLADERYRFVQLNLKYEEYPFKLSAEAIGRKRERTPVENDEYSHAAYLQAVYNLSFEHAVVSRVETCKDDYSNLDQQIFLLGYNYRPIYPVSLKAEYQWHNESADNRFLASFSVLF